MLRNFHLPCNAIQVNKHIARSIPDIYAAIKETKTLQIKNTNKTFYTYTIHICKKNRIIALKSFLFQNTHIELKV